MTTMQTPRRTTAELIAAARALQVLPAPSSPVAAPAQAAPALAAQTTVDETAAPAPQVAQPATAPRKRRSKPATEGPTA